MQIIKNAELEELKELGSGTFGTVYHGRWRGSDVAIKRIKKSCFAGRSSEEERLVSHFTFSFIQYFIIQSCITKLYCYSNPKFSNKSNCLISSVSRPMTSGEKHGSSQIFIIQMWLHFMELYQMEMEEL